MKIILVISIILSALSSYSNELSIITLSGDLVIVKLLDQQETITHISNFNGKKQDSLRKKWTARTYKLNNENLLLEFYDGSSAIISSEDDYAKLENVRFLKNYIDQLKKNVSYKIEIDEIKAKELINSSHTKHLKQYKSSSPKYCDFKLYKLHSDQILYIESTPAYDYAAVYHNIKTLASERDEIEAQEFVFQDDEYHMKELSFGNIFSDYDPNEHLIYPKYLDAVIASHKLLLKESNINVTEFWGDLYQSENGYWVLIDQLLQPNGNGLTMPILTLRIYESIEHVRVAQTNYEDFKKRGFQSEHMYQQISDKYGKGFPNKVDSLIRLLPKLLNFDSNQFTVDEQGIKILDEAIHWNHTNYKSFDSWFPSVFAYYGKYYIKSKNIGKWDVKLDAQSKVWIPQITLDDNSSAFDTIEFYKSLLEWPIPLEIAGDFQGKFKLIRQELRKRH